MVLFAVLFFPPTRHTCTSTDPCPMGLAHGKIWNLHPLEIIVDNKVCCISRILEVTPPEKGSFRDPWSIRTQHELMTVWFCSHGPRSPITVSLYSPIRKPSVALSGRGWNIPTWNDPPCEPLQF